jgi:hypothetical protein
LLETKISDDTIAPENKKGASNEESTATNSSLNNEVI